MTSSSIVIFPSWFRSSLAAEVPKKPCSSGSRIMLPFLSCCFTRLVAQLCKFAFVVVLEVEVDVAGAGVVEVAGREEPLVVPELVDGEPLLAERSSPRFSPRRSSSPRERLLRQSPRPRSPNRPRERSRLSSRPLLSDPGLP